MGEERDTSFAVPTYPESDYPTVERNDTPTRTFATELLDGLREQGTPIQGIQLIDARTPELYAGDEVAGAVDKQQAPLALRQGHIPGAVNVPWGRSVYPNALFRSADEIAEIYSDFDRDARTVIYCQMGESSAHTWFVLTHILGFKDASLYDGSWIEWGNMVRVPIERGSEATPEPNPEPTQE